MAMVNKRRGNFTSLSEPGLKKKKKNLQQGLPTFDKVTV